LFAFRKLRKFAGQVTIASNSFNQHDFSKVFGKTPLRADLQFEYCLLQSPTFSGARGTRFIAARTL
jgi:hypothetical protein